MKTRISVSAVLIGLCLGMTACAGTFSLDSKRLSGKKDLIMPASLSDHEDGGRWLAEANNCALAYNVAVRSQNRNSGFNFGFKAVEIGTITSVAIATGWNSQIDPSIGTTLDKVEAADRKRNLTIASLALAAVFTGFASFDNWYGFSERSTNHEKDAKEKITHLENAGYLIQCARRAEQSDDLRFLQIREIAVESAKRMRPGDAELIALLNDPNPRSATWKVQITTRLDELRKKQKKAIDVVRALSSPTTELKVKTELEREVSPQVVADIISVTADRTNPQGVSETAEEKVLAEMAKLDALKDFTAQLVHCDSAERNSAQLRDLAHDELIRCLDSRTNAFGPAPK